MGRVLTVLRVTAPWTTQTHVAALLGTKETCAKLTQTNVRQVRAATAAIASTQWRLTLAIAQRDTAGATAKLT